RKMIQLHRLDTVLQEQVRRLTTDSAIEPVAFSPRPIRITAGWVASTAHADPGTNPSAGAAGETLNLEAPPCSPGHVRRRDPPGARRLPAFPAPSVSLVGKSS